ncbi:uncharacterized protein BKCO1_3000190 [Diplodia corticola]|uniref:Uncharacterized protein n=1 Tax=Diplodia corticola TaxID=236234 RepID=A0A1J9SES3_9PEZI|nr:uncharacterized protein BKCO1_3000190 [Diplodia corticola]OJD38911.1 hypothetical protein BKCO1_3000190 [Diplodia corticola]
MLENTNPQCGRASITARIGRCMGSMLLVTLGMVIFHLVQGFVFLAHDCLRDSGSAFSRAVHDGGNRKADNAPAPVWGEVLGYIEKDGEYYGMTDALHEQKMKKLQEEHEDELDDLKAELTKLQEKFNSRERDRTRRHSEAMSAANAKLGQKQGETDALMQVLEKQMAQNDHLNQQLGALQSRDLDQITAEKEYYRMSHEQVMIERDNLHDKCCQLRDMVAQANYEKEQACTAKQEACDMASFRLTALDAANEKAQEADKRALLAADRGLDLIDKLESALAEHAHTKAELAEVEKQCECFIEFAERREQEAKGYETAIERLSKQLDRDGWDDLVHENAHLHRLLASRDAQIATLSTTTPPDSNHSTAAATAAADASSAQIQTLSNTLAARSALLASHEKDINDLEWELAVVSGSQIAHLTAEATRLRPLAAEVPVLRARVAKLQGELLCHWSAITPDFAAFGRECNRRLHAAWCEAMGAMLDAERVVAEQRGVVEHHRKHCVRDRELWGEELRFYFGNLDALGMMLRESHKECNALRRKMGLAVPRGGRVGSTIPVEVREGVRAIATRKGYELKDVEREAFDVKDRETEEDDDGSADAVLELELATGREPTAMERIMDSTLRRIGQKTSELIQAAGSDRKEVLQRVQGFYGSNNDARDGGETDTTPASPQTNGESSKTTLSSPEMGSENSTMPSSPSSPVDNENNTMFSFKMPMASFGQMGSILAEVKAEAEARSSQMKDDQ